jgi:hypothetical protein
MRIRDGIAVVKDGTGDQYLVFIPSVTAAGAKNTSISSDVDGEGGEVPWCPEVGGGNQRLSSVERSTGTALPKIKYLI